MIMIISRSQRGNLASRGDNPSTNNRGTLLVVRLHLVGDCDYCWLSCSRYQTSPLSSSAHFYLPQSGNGPDNKICENKILSPLYLSPSERMTRKPLEVVFEEAHRRGRRSRHTCDRDQHFFRDLRHRGEFMSCCLEYVWRIVINKVREK